MFRPSEMLVSFLQHLVEAGNLNIRFSGSSVEEVVQLEYDKFLLRMNHGNDEEIRCDGITIHEFHYIVSSFYLEYA